MASFTLKPARDPNAPKKDWPAIPDQEIVPVEVIKVELRDKPEWAIKDPNQTQEVSFRFRVLDGDHKGRNLWGNAAPYFSQDPRCRLRLWTQAVLGLDVLPLDFNLDLDELTGAHARVLVGNRETKDGVIKDFVQDVFQSRLSVAAATSSQQNFGGEEPFVVDAADWSPLDGYGEYPTRMLP